MSKPCKRKDITAVAGGESHQDQKAMILAQKEQSTIAKTRSDVGIFDRWLVLYKPGEEERHMYKIPPVELNTILACFWIQIRKNAEEDYEPNSLTSFMHSFDRYLRENDYGHSIKTDMEFDHQREVLKSRRKYGISYSCYC